MSKIFMCVLVLAATTSTTSFAEQSCSEIKTCFISKGQILGAATVKIMISNADGSEAKDVNHINVRAYPNVDAALEAAVVAAKTLEANGVCRYLPGWF